MINKTINIDLDNVDADGIAQSQTPSTSFTLNGALGTTLDYARIILLTSAGDESGKTVTISGTDSDSNTISETITGPNTTALSTKFFKTITSITVSSAFSGTCTVGTSATTRVATSHTVPVDYKAETAPVISVEITGTVNYTVQQTFDNILVNGTSTATWSNVGGLTSKTATSAAPLINGATGTRLRINSYSDTAEVQININSNATEDLDLNVSDITGALAGALVSATVATDDKILIQDTDDGNQVKTVTAQSIANLVEGSGGS